MSDAPAPGNAATSAQVVTVATRAMLPAARVLSASLRRHHPTWTHHVVLLGRGVPDRESEGLTVIAVEDELGLDPELLLAYHSVDELITLLVPRVLEQRRGDGLALHLPATTWVHAELDPLIIPLRRYPVLLAPRALEDPPSDGLEPTSVQLVHTGRVGTNLMGVDGSDAAGSFLRWWTDRLDRTLGALNGTTPGHHAHNRHWVYFGLELAAARLSATALRDPGSYLSAWNLHEHVLSADGDGIKLDGRGPLRLIDLAGFDPERPHQLRPFSSRIRLSRDPVLRSLILHYAEELRAAGWSDADRRRDLGQSLANGLVFDDWLQSLFAVAHNLGEDLPSPLTPEGTSALVDWVRAPAVHGGAGGVTRYVLHRVLRQRRDVVLAFPALDGADGSRLAEWARTSGVSEMQFPAELLSVPTPLAGATPDATAPADVEVPDPLPAREAATPVVVAPSDRAASRRDGRLAVRVSGYLSHVLGLGAAARGYADALSACGVTVSTATASLDHLQPSVRLAAGYGRHIYTEIAAERDDHGFELICVNPDELPGFVDRLGPEYFQGTRIGVWGWETTAIPERWAPAYDLVDEIWVYTRFVAENIGAVAPMPVLALPPPVRVPETPPEPIRLGVPEGFLFLFAFDYSSTTQRKNPVGLIEAFKRAFAPGEGARLVVKTINAPLLPLAEEEVLWAAGDRPDIHVIDCSLTGEERDGLLAACDCYVSLHRSEGFGLTLAEAMALGKPVIGTAYSGNVDFMNPENSFLVDYTLTRVGADCQIYPADGEWAEPSVEHAAALMRQVYEDPEAAAQIGARARQDVARTLSPQATGAAMRERLERLLRNGSLRGQRLAPVRS
jgi:glycosyltransferase involved in cell wall biosynthesis